jgi:hypothetical protein
MVLLSVIVAAVVGSLLWCAATPSRNYNVDTHRRPRDLDIRRKL